MVSDKCRFHAGGIPARIAADMDHKNRQLLACPTELLREFLLYFFSVDIAVNSFERFESGQCFCNFRISEVPGMPDLIAVIEMAEDLFIKKRMSVRYESDTCQKVIIL